MSSAKSGISAEDSSVPSKVFAIAVFAVDSRHEYVIPALLDAAFRTYCPGKILLEIDFVMGLTNPSRH
jgi:hypothetical protein